MELLSSCAYSIDPHSKTPLLSPSTSQHREAGLVHQGTQPSQLLGSVSEADFFADDFSTLAFN